MPLDTFADEPQKQGAQFPKHWQRSG
jgi:hypothetical protein